MHAFSYNMRRTICLQHRRGSSRGVVAHIYIPVSENEFLFFFADVKELEVRPTSHFVNCRGSAAQSGCSFGPLTCGKIHLTQERSPHKL